MHNQRPYLERQDVKDNRALLTSCGTIKSSHDPLLDQVRVLVPEVLCIDTIYKKEQVS